MSTRLQTLFVPLISLASGWGTASVDIVGAFAKSRNAVARPFLYPKTIASIFATISPFTTPARYVAVQVVVRTAKSSTTSNGWTSHW